MKPHLASLLAAASLVIAAGSASAQTRDAGSQPVPKQSAPAESPHASGHDVQTGQPQSAEKEKTGVSGKSSGTSSSGDAGTGKTNKSDKKPAR